MDTKKGQVPVQISVNQERKRHSNSETNDSDSKVVQLHSIIVHHFLFLLLSRDIRYQNMIINQASRSKSDILRLHLKLNCFSTRYHFYTSSTP